MHLLLTDRLVCPRCGPDFGLILLTDRMADRMVLQGTLGCPNCRDAYPIHEGFGDLRAPPRKALGAGLAGPAPADHADESEAVTRLVALLGIVGGPGLVALIGAPARLAVGLARALPEAQVVAVDADLAGWAEVAGVSRIVAAPGLPFRSASARGLALDGRLGRAWAEEAARVLSPRGRLVVSGVPLVEARAMVEDAGLRVLAAEGETVVATRD